MIVGASSNIGSGHSRAERGHAVDRPEHHGDDSGRPAGTALVPIGTLRRPMAVSPLTRPDSAFVAHLIATMDQAPQTRTHRRASVTDAMSRYRAMTLVASGEERPAVRNLSRVA